MGFVAALLSVKVYLAARTGPVPRVVLPRKLFWLAHASIRVPSTVKCSSDKYGCACASTRWKNASAISSFSSRSPILAEHRVVPHLLVHLHPHKPPQPQVVLQLFHQQPFAPHPIENMQKQNP